MKPCQYSTQFTILRITGLPQRVTTEHWKPTRCKQAFRHFCSSQDSNTSRYESGDRFRVPSAVTTVSTLHPPRDTDETHADKTEARGTSCFQCPLTCNLCLAITEAQLHPVQHDASKLQMFAEKNGTLVKIHEGTSGGPCQESLLEESPSWIFRAHRVCSDFDPLLIFALLLHMVCITDAMWSLRKEHGNQLDGPLLVHSLTGPSPTPT